MQRDDDQRNAQQPKPLEPPQEIVNATQPESPPEDDVDAGDSVINAEPSVPLDPPAADLSASSLGASDLSEGESDSQPRLDPAQEEAASNADTLAQSAPNVTRFELPAEISIPTTRPSQTGRDQSSRLLPLDPGGAMDDEPDPVDEIFPPELRLPSDPGPPPRTPVAEPVVSEAGRPMDAGQTMPRVQVIVSLAGARALGEEVLEEALTQAAPEFEQIAQSEIKLYDFRQDNKRRAADYRLRGPG